MKAADPISDVAVPFLVKNKSGRGSTASWEYIYVIEVYDRLAGKESKIGTVVRLMRMGSNFGILIEKGKEAQYMWSHIFSRGSRQVDMKLGKRDLLADLFTFADGML